MKIIIIITIIIYLCIKLVSHICAAGHIMFTQMIGFC